MSNEKSKPNIRSRRYSSLVSVLINFNLIMIIKHFSVILVIILLIIIASTIYDVYLSKSSGITGRRQKMLLAFSAYTNGSKIIKASTNSDQIQFFNGMKVLSMIWIIIGHSFEFYNVLFVNKEDIEEVLSKICMKWEKSVISCNLFLRIIRIRIVLAIL